MEEIPNQSTPSQTLQSLLRLRRARFRNGVTSCGCTLVCSLRSSPASPPLPPECLCGLGTAHPSLHANPPVCWCPCCLSVFLSEPQALWLIAKWTLNHNCFHLNVPRIESLSLTFSPFPFLNQTSLSAVCFCSQLVALSSPNLQASGTPPSFTTLYPIRLRVGLPCPTPCPSSLSRPLFWFLSTDS